MKTAHEREDEHSPRVYTVAESARILKVQQPKIRKAILAGDLPAARIGRLFRIREDDLMTYFEDQMVHGHDEQKRGA